MKLVRTLINQTLNLLIYSYNIQIQNIHYKFELESNIHFKLQIENHYFVQKFQKFAYGILHVLHMTYSAFAYGVCSKNTTNPEYGVIALPPWYTVAILHLNLTEHKS